MIPEWVSPENALYPPMSLSVRKTIHSGVLPDLPRIIFESPNQ